MTKYIDPDFKCDKCKIRPEELHAKFATQPDWDGKWFCITCFEKKFGKKEKKNEVTNTILEN